jgi:hypothetical protein
MTRIHIPDIPLIVFTIIFVIVSFYYFVFKKEQIFLNFKIEKDSLKIHVFPFVTLTFSYQTFDSIKVISYGESISFTFRFNGRVTNDVISIKRKSGLVREFVIGPDKVLKFYEDLKKAVEESKK